MKKIVLSARKTSRPAQPAIGTRFISPGAGKQEEARQKKESERQRLAFRTKKRRLKSLEKTKSASA